MTKQWVAVCLFVVAVCVAPFLASALQRRGGSRITGYVTGLALIAIAALWVRHVGGFPGSSAP